MPKELILLRGLPHAGKSTFASFLLNSLVYSDIGHTVNFEADQYFTDEDGNYSYDGMFIGDAHLECQRNTECAMIKNIGVIIVSNTFTREKELQPYLEMAKEFGYKTTVLIVEGRHGNKNQHLVPSETIDKMRNRFSVKL